MAAPYPSYSIPSGIRHRLRRRSRSGFDIEAIGPPTEDRTDEARVGRAVYEIDSNARPAARIGRTSVHLKNRVYRHGYPIKYDTAFEGAAASVQHR